MGKGDKEMDHSHYDAMLNTGEKKFHLKNSWFNPNKSLLGSKTFFLFFPSKLTNSENKVFCWTKWAWEREKKLMSFVIKKRKFKKFCLQTFQHRWVLPNTKVRNEIKIWNFILSNLFHLFFPTAKNGQNFFFPSKKLFKMFPALHSFLVQSFILKYCWRLWE